MGRGARSKTPRSRRQRDKPLSDSPLAGRSERVYQKGSAVLDMMRYTFGEEAVPERDHTHYLRAHAYGSVETNDLYQAFQDVLGLSPGWFFDEWIYRGGEPHYACTFEENHPERHSGRTRSSPSGRFTSGTSSSGSSGCPSSSRSTMPTAPSTPRG